MKTHRRFTMLCVFLLLVVSLCSASAQVREGAKPDLELKAMDGTTVTLSKLQGAVVLVDFWATWCAPCLKSLPYYAELHERFAAQGLVILAVSVDEDRAAIERFLKGQPLPFPVLHDSNHKVSQTFSPPTMPTFFLVDREGRVDSLHTGFRSSDRSAIEARIRTLLAREAP